jgi:hypothetical protein
VLSTTTTSTPQLRTAIPFAGLALTIQDAIGVTHKLESRYIWIDSLCILQDDAQDWEREAKNMCTVYRNATLTIAALGAAHAAEGLFSRRDPLILAGCRVPSSRQIRVPEPLPDMAYWSLYLDKSALQTRGWTFQEPALSSRILHFGSSLLWECDSSFKPESDTSDLGRIPTPGFSPLLYPPTGASGIPALKQWGRLVEEFISRNLTVATHRLPTISGLITHFERQLVWTNVSVLWKEHLSTEMLWTLKTSNACTSLDNNAPTWSWISAQGPVRYLHTLFESRQSSSPRYSLTSSILLLPTFAVPF